MLLEKTALQFLIPVIFKANQVHCNLLQGYLKG